MPISYAELDALCQWQPDRDQAAITALMRLPQGKTELAGALYQNDKGEWCYSKPVRSASKDNFEFKIRNPPGAKFGGLYHNHPQSNDDKTNSSFSANDIDTADKLKVASYIRSMRDDSVKRYVPGESEVRMKLGGNGRLSDGTDITPKILAAAIRDAK